MIKTALTALLMGIAGWGMAQEVTDAFLDLQRTGKVNESESVMRIRAGEENLRALMAGKPECGYFCFPEDRLLDMRSTDFVPLRWAQTSSAARAVYSGKTRPGEFFTWQVGLYAVDSGLEDVKLVFSDLKGGNGDCISADSLRCFNLGGSGVDGRTFVKRVDVPQGKLQALWIGAGIPAEAVGVYEGTLTVKPRNAHPTVIRLSLTVGGDPLKNRGDNEGWRHSRLRWLDSRVGEDSRPTGTYSPVQVSGLTLIRRGGEVTLGESGLPVRIVTRYNSCNALDTTVANEVLREGMKLVIETDGGVEQLKFARPDLRQVSPEKAEWTARATGRNIGVVCRGIAEFDGFSDIRLEVTGRRDVSIKDIRLEIPYTEYASRYFMGLGETGGLRRKGTLEWKWDTVRHQDEYWMGNVNAGLKVKLKDESYTRPLVNIYYSFGRLRMPRSWSNGGQGGVDVRPETGGVRVVAYSGARVLRKGESLHYNLELLVTPVKPLDMEHQVKDRFYHSNSDVSAGYITGAAEAGANLINVHHKKDIYPFINYPYSDESVADLQKFIGKAHARNIGVRAYYTTRELTVKTPEIWALRSLGSEVIMDGPGRDARTLIHSNGPNQWLCDNLGDHFVPAWYNAFKAGKYKGDMDISVLTTPDSRWNNYYLEGLAWMVNRLGLDGIYIDDSALDRETLKRGRRILDADGRHRTVDMHSWNHMNQWAGYANSVLMYMDLLPYVDRLWIGEGFKVDNRPDFWLVEMSGIPFGLMSETLDARNYWRGMAFGMTPRLPWSGNPRPMWKMYDDFGMESAVMYGFWNEGVPVTTTHPEVLATVYVKKDKAMVVVANWTDREQVCRLKIDPVRLGFQPSRISLPAMEGVQEAQKLTADSEVPLKSRGGVFVLMEK